MGFIEEIRKIEKEMRVEEKLKKFEQRKEKQFQIQNDLIISILKEITDQEYLEKILKQFQTTNHPNFLIKNPEIEENLPYLNEFFQRQNLISELIIDSFHKENNQIYIQLLRENQTIKKIITKYSSVYISKELYEVISKMDLEEIELRVYKCSQHINEFLKALRVEKLKRVLLIDE
jgi:hypothetical protein